MPKGKPVTEEFIAKVNEAIAVAGNQTELAKAIGKSPACVSSWATGRSNSVTGKSMRQVSEFLELARTPKSVPINTSYVDRDSYVAETDELLSQKLPSFCDKNNEILVPKNGEKIPVSENDNTNYAQEVLSEFVEVRKRQKGILLGWQINLIRRAEQILGLRDERNEPIGQYRCYSGGLQ